jgi:hypothetical protein
MTSIGSSLTTAPNSSVVCTDGGEGDSLFWQVSSSATFAVTMDTISMGLLLGVIVYQQQSGKQAIRRSGE